MKKILMKRILMNKIKYKIFFTNFFLYIKIENKYQKHKERPQKEAHERHQNPSEEEKDKRRTNAREIYQSFTEEEKEKKRQIYQET